MEKKSENRASNDGIGFVEALQLLFIALKLMKQITWSWLWVLAPAWITLALCIVIGIFYGCLTVAKKRKKAAEREERIKRVVESLRQSDKEFKVIKPENPERRSDLPKFGDEE